MTVFLGIAWLAIIIPFEILTSQMLFQFKTIFGSAMSCLQQPSVASRMGSVAMVAASPDLSRREGALQNDVIQHWQGSGPALLRILRAYSVAMGENI